MPELPEVETIVRELRPKLVGKKIWKMEAIKSHGKYAGSSNFQPSMEEIISGIQGLKILGIQRRGKYIVFELSGKMFLIIHLRMTGRLLWKKDSKNNKHLRAIFQFTDGMSLYFADTRKFGRVWFYHQQDFLKKTGMWKLGIEPFDPAFTLEKIQEMFGKRRGILKNNLLRQDLIAGIGNIYADEICFRINLHPSSRLENLKKKDLEKLHAAIRFCLEEGISHNGASVSDFVGTNGTLGKHQNYLKVYGRKGDQCYVCSGIIQKTVAAGRGTFFCAKCQEKR